MSKDALAASKSALKEAMKRENVEVLVLFGNNWHADHLRYATDFGIQEGQGVALVREDGTITLILDDPAECERARVDSTCETIYAPALVAEAKKQLARAGNHNIAAAPYHLLPYGLLHGDKDLRVSDGAKIVERLLMNKMEIEIAAVRKAAALADEGYAIFRNAARPGRKDYELVAEMESFFRARGVPENFMIVGVVIYIFYIFIQIYYLAVEASLGVRPLSAKNWNPGETAADIARQDAEALGVK
jgi:Xaa-Pro aminopeptidase